MPAIDISFIINKVLLTWHLPSHSPGEAAWNVVALQILVYVLATPETVTTWKFVEQV